MKRLFKDRVKDGVGFSENGARAYARGEKPIFMWDATTALEPTCVHHIEREIGAPARWRYWRRSLVMFYREAKQPSLAQ